ncbi:MAG: WhiB family transcriptional regulator [Ilumatobacter fluminis]|jgi:WhiB family redox-sensing transcriptional regulator|uniref:WhiB family redox-sensing transcriptional regulator n=1 Tax=Ilumatobacter fluminis TaxID=467091 RepID=A0A4R7HW68_9ACTN|nr:WhiB family transcriptional regulator [Ilumatobacter fluminis]TDT15060.1 WhiB family redox-sensing transcriptional regulator [Ilumatobacter fluminis]
MTLIDLPVGGRAADDIDDNTFDRFDQDERRGVSWAHTDDEASTADEPQLSSYPRCSDGNGTLTHLFFSDDEFDIARAKAICGKCGLAESCLTSALERAEPYGVWGGSLVIDGVIVEVKRGRGRPPKHPRPPLVVDEVPLPPHLVA